MPWSGKTLTVTMGPILLKPPEMGRSEVCIGHLQPGMMGEWQGGTPTPAARNFPAGSSNSSEARPTSGPCSSQGIPTQGPKPPYRAIRAAPSSWPPVLSSVTEPPDPTQ